MESLKNKKIISELFVTGKKIYITTINAKYLPGNPEIMISVPIRLFKRAVDRNRLKRLMRESIRTKDMKQMNIALIYASSKVEDFKTIDNDIKKIFEKIEDIIYERN